MTREEVKAAVDLLEKSATSEPGRLVCYEATLLSAPWRSAEDWRAVCDEMERRGWRRVLNAVAMVKDLPVETKVCRCGGTFEAWAGDGLGRCPSCQIAVPVVVRAHCPEDIERRLLECAQRIQQESGQPTIVQARAVLAQGWKSNPPPPQGCECGAHRAMGIGQGQIGHSHWCPWAER